MHFTALEPILLSYPDRFLRLNAGGCWIAPHGSQKRRKSSGNMQELPKIVTSPVLSGC